MNEITQYQLSLEIVNATKEQLEDWSRFIIIDSCSDGESDEYYSWDEFAPDHLKKLDPYDVLTEYWRR